MSNNGLCGLKNFGNSCWLNASLQCIIASEHVSNFFLSDYIKKYLDKNDILSIQYIKLLMGIQNENCIISPLSLFKAIIISANKNGYVFNFAHQNDAQEFLLFFIDTLHEEIKHKVNITVSGKIVNEIDKMAFDAMNYWKDYFKNNYSKIIDIFYGQLVTKTKVIDKDIQSFSYAPICIFSLPINNSDSETNLYESFDLFCKPQVLDGENKWKYEKDNKLYSVTQNTMIWKFPKILIIHLKRFTNDGRKINKLIDFPINDLNLKNYCVGYEQNKSKFRLFGICNHIGRLHGGHYFSYCKRNGKWYKFDDDTVSKIDESDIKTQNAYCLFYEKID